MLNTDHTHSASVRCMSASVAFREHNKQSQAPSIVPHYRPEIDGLRALAVTAVVLFHFGMGVPGGYLGVDVFFVISGYLISGILYRHKEASGTTVLGTFYARRARRILPAAAAVTISVLCMGYMLFAPKDFVELAEAAIASSTFSANIYFWLTSGYFAPDAEARPLLHFWSLAVEEQFYFVFPFLFLLLCRSLSTKTLFATLLIGCFTLLALAEYLTHVSPNAAFYLLPARSWELLAGGCLFAWESTRRRATEPTLSNSSIFVAGALILTGCFCFYNENSRFPGMGSVPIVVASIFLLKSASTAPPALRSVLTNRFSTGLGKLSYSIYLWHWPAIVFANYLHFDAPTMTLKFGLLPLVMFLSWISYRFIESPIRFARLGTWKSLSLGTAIQVATLLPATWIYLQQGIPARMPTRVLNMVAAATEQPVAGPPESQAGSIYGDPPNTPVVLLWGDSHAAAIAGTIDRVCIEKNLKLIRSIRVGHVPLLGAWRLGQFDSHEHWQASVLRTLRNNTVAHVILIARWPVYIEGRPSGENDTLLTNEMRTSTANHQVIMDADKVFESALQTTLETLSRGERRISIMLQVPEFPVDVPRTAAAQLLLGKDEVDISISYCVHKNRQRRANEIIHRVANRFPDLVFVYDPITYIPYNETNTINAHMNDTLFYRDKHHLSDAGAQRLLPLVEELLDTSFQTNPPQPVHVR
ncbi:acyltransferase family protein [Gimesia maris]|uniref:acyltransferase family protein n=1 Tax=Gimesia maris TaxID=122 RepID=UPI003A9176DA